MAAIIILLFCQDKLRLLFLPDNNYLYGRLGRNMAAIANLSSGHFFGRTLIFIV